MRRLAATAFVLLVVSCGRFRPNEWVIIRPSCGIRVVDEVTGFPLANVRVTIVTLYGGVDTVGSWTYTTDEDGVVGIASDRSSRRAETLKGRKGAGYIYIATFEGYGYCYFSQRITANRHLVRLSRDFPIADTDVVCGRG